MFDSLFKVFPSLFYIWVIYFAMPSSPSSYIFSSAVPNPWLFPSGCRGETAKAQRCEVAAGGALGTVGVQCGLAMLSFSSALGEKKAYILVHCMDPLQEPE